MSPNGFCLTQTFLSSLVRHLEGWMSLTIAGARVHRSHYAVTTIICCVSRNNGPIDKSKQKIMITAECIQGCEGERDELWINRACFELNRLARTNYTWRRKRAAIKTASRLDDCEEIIRARALARCINLTRIFPYNSSISYYTMPERLSASLYCFNKKF